MRLDVRAEAGHMKEREERLAICDRFVRKNDLPFQPTQLRASHGGSKAKHNHCSLEVGHGSSWIDPENVERIARVASSRQLRNHWRLPHPRRRSDLIPENASSRSATLNLALFGRASQWTNQYPKNVRREGKATMSEYLFWYDSIRTKLHLEQRLLPPVGHVQLALVPEP